MTIQPAVFIVRFDGNPAGDYAPPQQAATADGLFPAVMETIS
jgi:hypothetical protein